MATQNPRNPNAAVELPEALPPLEPEAVVELLRALRAQLGEVTPLTTAERRLLRRQAQTSNPVLQASINMIGAHDQVSQAVAQPAGGVRRMYDEANRWTAVEDELRTLLGGSPARTSCGASGSRSSPGRPTTSVRSWRAIRPMPCCGRTWRRSSG